MTEQSTIPVDSSMLNKELMEREAELSIISSIQQALASNLDVQSIYNLVGDKIRDIFDSQVVMISTYDPQAETIEHRYAIERGEHIFAPGRYPIRGFRTQIVQTRQPVLVNSNVAEQAARLGQHTIPGTITPKSWLGVPMVVGDQVTGILSLQNVDRENAFDDADVRLLQTLAATMSVSLENARLFEETQRLLKETEQRAKELQIINNVQVGLAQKLDEASIYELVGEKISEFYSSIDLCIMVYQSSTDLLSVPFQMENGVRESSLPYNVSGKGFIGHLLKHPQPLLINEGMEKAVVQYEHVYTSGKGLPKSALYMPLMIGGSMQGAIVMKDMQAEQSFKEADIHLLTTLVNAMSVALENARLWEQEELYLKALEREFVIGREIQASFLPNSLPQPAGWELAASLRSAREVTGDFYDAFILGEDKIGLVIADVCDKGLGAALFMTLFRSLIRAVANIDFLTNVEYAGGFSATKRIKHTISLTNKYIAETHGKTSMFATVFFGILDIHTGVLTYANAGHLPPLVINRDGIKDILRQTGPAVGLVADTEYSISEVAIDQGDTFFAHTDGMTDTINTDGEYFSEMDLVPLLGEEQSLQLLLEQIQDKVKQFSGKTEQVDDITILAGRRKEIWKFD